MRAVGRRRHVEDEEESVFVSMTDMTVSFLFIVMILLAFFASQLQTNADQPTVPKAQYNDLRREHLDLQSKYDRLKSERDRLELDLQVARKTIANLARIVGNRHAAIAELRTELAAKVARIAELERTVATLEQAILELQRNLDVKTAAIDDLRREATVRDIKISDLEHQLADRDQLIQGLREEILVLQDRIRELEAEKDKVNPLEVYIGNVAKQRRIILEKLRDWLKQDFPSLDVEISDTMDALRFKGDGLFARGQYELVVAKREVVEHLADKLSALLPCYTLGERSHWSEDCNAVGAVIEAVQIEGHTDSDGDDASNLALSARRAVSTFNVMKSESEPLLHFKNIAGQPVLSVAGYGKMRPVATNETPEGKATNRRIDLRIIMYTPQREDDIARARADLEKGVSGMPTP